MPRPPAISPPRKTAGLCVFVAMAAITSAQAETWVVTDRAHPVTLPAGVRLIQLDEQQRLEDLLSRSLPDDPEQAARAAQRVMNSPQGQRLQQELAKAQQDLTDAWSVGVAKIPAVVVDRRYVVYGQPDVAAALRLIEARRTR
ncbi:integrating conjugative element protein, PFL_4709 family [Azotobacter vinelandii]|nr:integrating conjugative element protein, PFL_4709 family [Azotobacter vinelandii]